MSMSHEERLEKDRVRKRLKRKQDPEYRKRENERSREYAKSHQFELKAYHKNYRRTLSQERRMEVMDMLGGRKCCKCGYDADIRALQIDHIDGGGNLQRREHPLPDYTYYKCILESGGVGFQILCANCNVIKKFENGEV